MILGLGLWAATVLADSLEFATPLPYSKFAQGDLVPIIYKVHHSGMAELVWAKVHLMTEDGFDAGMGTIATTSRDQWQGNFGIHTACVFEPLNSKLTGLTFLATRNIVGSHRV